jgi:hypothetical protein
MNQASDYYGDLGISVTGGLIFTTIVMLALIAWVVWIYVVNYGPKAKAQQAAEAEARRHPQVTPPTPSS